MKKFSSHPCLACKFVLLPVLCNPLFPVQGQGVVSGDAVVGMEKIKTICQTGQVQQEQHRAFPGRIQGMLQGKKGTKRVQKKDLR